MAFSFREAGHHDTGEIAELFLVRFPWLNNNWNNSEESPRTRVQKNIDERLDTPRSITLVGEYEGRLFSVLRGHVVDWDNFLIDAFCTDDRASVCTRARMIAEGYRSMLPLIVDFARQHEARFFIFDTHVANLSSFLLKLIDRGGVGLEHFRSEGTNHAFAILPKRKGNE